MTMTFLGHSKICSRARRAQGFLRNAFDEARNRKTVSWGDKSLLHARHGPTLVAVNRYSHELWGRAVCDQLSAFFCSPGSVEHNRDIYFVTLLDISCATSVSSWQ
jgi:hypothetical protein